ncbi:MAG: hypothetical protein QG608_756 [Actinomycetota bacterium]|nr:hypothetical protein [Actinomycetota bacterium]
MGVLKKEGLLEMVRSGGPRRTVRYRLAEKTGLL